MNYYYSFTEYDNIGKMVVFFIPVDGNDYAMEKLQERIEQENLSHLFSVDLEYVNETETINKLTNNKNNLIEYIILEGELDIDRILYDESSDNIYHWSDKLLNGGIQDYVEET